MSDLTLGPFAFRAELLAACLAVLLGLVVGKRIAARAGASIERLLWIHLGVAILAARMAFVVRYRDVYLEAPLRILDLRDGGFKPVVGVAAALALAGWLAWRDRRRRAALLAGVLSASLAWGAGSAALALAKPRQGLPDLVLADLDGREMPTSALAGRPLVVNLWASWCPPCRREMPELARAQSAYPDVRFVFVNQGERPEEVRAYLREQQVRIDNVLLDRTGRFAKATGSPGLPTTLFFDANGRLAGRRLGQLSMATLDEAIEPLRQARATPTGARPSRTSPP